MIDPLQPHLIGDGPVDCPATRTLVRYPPVIVDANGYYRVLGVDVRAGKRDIMRAYVACDGQSDARLTYIIKLLLNPKLRRMYDAIELGNLYVDPWIEQELRRRGMLAVDDIEGQGHDVVASNQDQSWPWAWYRWETSETDPDPLIRWQAALLSHLGDRPGMHFAVGLHGSESPVVVRRVGYRIVAFLRVGHEPGRADIMAAVQQLTQHIQHNDDSGEAQQWPTPSSVVVSSAPKKQPRRAVVVSRVPPSSASTTKSPRSSGSSRKSTRAAATSSTKTATSVASRST